jgi:hypothetical protein
MPKILPPKSVPMPADDGTRVGPFIFLCSFSVYYRKAKMSRVFGGPIAPERPGGSCRRPAHARAGADESASRRRTQNGKYYPPVLPNLLDILSPFGV